MIEDIKWVLHTRPDFMGSHKVLMVKFDNEWTEVRTEEFTQMETPSQDGTGRIKKPDHVKLVSANQN